MEQHDAELGEETAAITVPAKHPVVGPYVPKHWRIFGEMIRTAAAVIAVCLNLTVLILLVSR